MQRRLMLKAMAGIPLGCTLMAPLLAAGNRPPGMQRVRGKVEINGQPAREGMRILPGDTVSTGADGEAVYVIGQDAYLQRNGSSVRFSDDPLKAGLRVLNGRLMAVFGKGSQQLETATATIGIRGTGCYIESSPERVYFCLCYGTADIVPAADPTGQQRITTRHHDQPMYILPDGQRAMVPADMENHTDDELMMLEALVGREPPFIADGSHAKRYP